MESFEFLFDLPAYQSGRLTKSPAGGHWKQGVITTAGYTEVLETQQRIALYLLDRGIQKGDRIILITERFNLLWLAMDMAIMSIGAISVPVHHPQREEDLISIFNTIKPVLIVRTKELVFGIKEGAFPFMFFGDLVKAESPQGSEGIKRLSQLRQSMSPNDITTIVHTSGSSGEPRAVSLSHHNIMSNVMSLLTLVPFVPGTKVMSFLPLSHIFERIVCYVYLASGASIYFLDSYRYVVYAIKDIRPEYFTSVPLILERFAAALEDRVEEMGWFTRWAYGSWEDQKKSALTHLGSLIAHHWIIKRWKQKLGGNLKGIISGAAYLDPKIEKLYERSGIKIRQGYGLTEASPVVTINRFEPGGHRRGTVGLPIPGVEVRIAEDGEILVKGPNVMVGYYLDDHATQKVIHDGWLHTGDIGYWEKENFLVISDRKSSIYKHASGKFIAPAKIESILTQATLIRYAMIIGYHRPFNIALIVPDFESLKKVCDGKQIHWTAPEYMVHNTLVLQIFRQLLDQLDLLSHERIEKFILLADEWNTENGMLTPTFKPRRKEIEGKYTKIIEDLYL